MLRFVKLCIVFAVLFYYVDGFTGVKVVATVDDELISSLDVEKRVKIDKLLYKVDGKVAYDMSLKFLIDEALWRREAKNLKISVSDEDMKEAINRILKLIGADGDTSLFSYVQENDLDYKTVLRHLESKILWDKILLLKVIPYINVSDDEIESYIAESKSDKFETIASLNQVFIPLKSKDIVQVILKELCNNVSVSDIKNRYKAYDISIDKVSISVNLLDHKIKKNLVKANVGQVIDPIEFVQGYLIIQLLDKVQISRKFMHSEVTLKQVLFDDKDKNKLNTITKLQNSQADCLTFNKVVSELKLGNAFDVVVKVKDLSTKLQALLQNAKVGNIIHFSSDSKEHVIILCEVKAKDFRNKQDLDEKEINSIRQNISMKKLGIKSMQLMSQLYKNYLVERY
ncbi:SurA N-terminal domain-containing protein [Candidatus Neoehrlichia procyonis]|uniref:SurA N-terminal domain protein n=1 Tax=Candidatus Neoehrlichia procyonis str. RAC413 TaxID=1359163 RepID=A0A0F3NNE0_9RICK|nr:SurA N-terminal domain-containing protein [Candidatus Neoehrlichia lotoris]KJV69217.1 surA N-terminal domain protein [Candidatus Neoehrlichia lotoris str. RAC413]